MVSQADLDLIQNFAIELEPFVETVLDGVREYEHPVHDTVVVGQAVQSLGMIRGAGSILMIDPLVQITDMLSEAFDVLQANQRSYETGAVADLHGLAEALQTCLRAMVRGDSTEPAVRSAQHHLAELMRAVVETDRLNLRTSTPHNHFSETEPLGNDLTASAPPAIETYHPPKPSTEPARHHAEGGTYDLPSDADVIPPLSEFQDVAEPLDPELREIFLEEATDLVTSFRDNAIALSRSPGDRDLADALRRDAHTLKGAANMTGFLLIGQVGAAVENLIDRHVDAEIPVDRDALELALVCWKMLPAMLKKLDDLSMFVAPVASVVRRSDELLERLGTVSAEEPRIDGGVSATDSISPDVSVEDTDDIAQEQVSVSSTESEIRDEAPSGDVSESPVAPRPGHLRVDPDYLDQFGRENRQSGPDLGAPPMPRAASPKPATASPGVPADVLRIREPADERVISVDVEMAAAPERVEAATVQDAPSRERLGSALLDLAFTSGRQPAEPADHAQSIEPAEVYDESRAANLATEMFELFAVECADLVEILSRAAMSLEREPRAARPRRDLLHALHTLKGAASAADLDAIADECHHLEELLAGPGDAQGPTSQETIHAVYATIERIEELMDARGRELADVDGGAGPDPVEAGARLRVPVSSLDSLLNLVGELVVNRAGFEQRLDRLSGSLDELSLTADRLRRSGQSLERRSAFAANGSGYVPGAQAGDWDDLEFDRYTEFDRLIRELAEIGADIGASVSELGQLRGDLDTVSSRQRRLTTAMQDELMDIRMVPISSMAPRLYRIIRQVAATRGKEVRLVFEGGETTFDSTLLEALSESLLHLLRNAVDHGIEPPSERRKLGKDATGTIRVRSYRDGGEAVIDVIDDGSGIDADLIAERARELGFNPGDQASKQDVLRLIFQPGFTTREQADGVSGRGVGLEIVEDAVSRFKGRVRVDSAPGKGTVISLRLPVLLSVTQAFMVASGGEKYAVPIGNIDFVADRREQPLSRMGDNLVLQSGDSVIPAIDLGNRLGRGGDEIDENDGWIMVARVADERWALCVDELDGQQEIVVKPLGRFARNTPGVVGATILGNGDVALIVDVPRLIAVDSSAVSAGIQNVASSDITRDDRPVSDRPQVALIVDDSLSVRRVVSRTIERHGWVPVLARDGQEALELLESGPVDVVITDIEMPRMDGYELMVAVRSGDVARQAPVIVLTSRSGQKHRERAFELGASAYVVKPFQEQQLIEAIENAIGVRSAGRG